jgi:hypothetical protein
VATPPGVVIAIVPLAAPAGTVAVTRIWKSDSTAKVVAGTPPKVTFDVCVRPVPSMTTWDPTCALAGSKLVSVGMTLNSLAPQLMEAFGRSDSARRLVPVSVRQRTYTSIVVIGLHVGIDTPTAATCGTPLPGPQPCWHPLSDTAQAARVLCLSPCTPPCPKTAACCCVYCANCAR